MRVLLASVKRAADDRLRNPTGLAVAKTLGCACLPLTKAKRSRRKKIGSKQYLAWLDAAAPDLASKLHKFLKREMKQFKAYLLEELQLGKVRKVSQADIDRIIAGLDFSKWTDLYGILERELVQAFKDNAKAGFQAIGFDPDEDMVELVNEQALEWAQRRAAELVGKRKNEDGEWVDNPNKKFAISESTREELRGMVSDAIDEGWSADTFADEIADAFSFSEARSMTIARTELAFAHVEGNLEAWGDSGVVEMKQSILGSEHDLDDQCNDNADAGPIPLNAEFPSGHQGPPYHPNCVCDVIPVLGE